MDLLKRYLGAGVGTICSDAIAAAYEHQKSEDIRRDIKRRGGLVPHRYVDPWNRARGNPDKLIDPMHPTDDGELFAAGLWSIARRPDFDPAHMYQAFRRFIILRKPLLTKDAYGMGGTLKSALEPKTYQLSMEKFSRGEVVLLPSNGALMRCKWVPMRFHGKTPKVVKFARWQSCLTHMHPLSQAACIAYSVLGSQILDGLHPRVAWEVTRDILTKPAYAQIPELAGLLRKEPIEPPQEDIWPNTGSVELTFRVVLWATLTAKDFRDGITKCTEIGGDTDTYAAIAGGLLGAHYGIDGIPAEWQDVQGRKVIERLSTQVYKLAHP